MLVGDSGVGKTCLLVRFKDGAFLAGSFISTVGIDFRVSAWGAPRPFPGVWQVSDGCCRGVTKHCSEDLNLVSRVSSSQGARGVTAAAAAQRCLRYGFAQGWGSVSSAQDPGDNSCNN